MYAKSILAATASALLLTVPAHGTATAALPIGTKQSTAVTGTLTAGDAPATNTRIKLYDTNTLADDLLADATPDAATGSFRLEGHTTRLDRMTPHIKILTKVGTEARTCSRSITIEIPEDAITVDSHTPTATYDLGTIDLASQAFPGETTDCLS